MVASASAGALRVAAAAAAGPHLAARKVLLVLKVMVGVEEAGVVDDRQLLQQVVLVRRGPRLLLRDMLRVELRRVNPILRRTRGLGARSGVVAVGSRGSSIARRCGGAS